MNEHSEPQQKIESSLVESAALRRSIFGYAVFGLLGIGFATVTHSNAILLDGYYSIIAGIVSILALKVSRMVALPEDDTHPFGYAGYEPLLNAIKGLLILVLCLFALGNSVVALFDQGREPVFGIAIVYSAICTVGCFTLAWLQRRAAKLTGSSLLAVDARSWVFDGILSGLVGAAFAGGILLSSTAYAHFVPYVDPALTAALVLFLLPVPIRTILEGIGQLVFAAANRYVTRQIVPACEEAIRPWDSTDSRIRVVQIGRSIYVLITVAFEQNAATPAISELDRLRSNLAGQFRQFAPKVVVDIIPTHRAELL